LPESPLNQSENVRLQEFKPTIIFLSKFVLIYVIGNLLYGWYVTSFHPRPDVATRIVSEHTAFAVQPMLEGELRVVDNVKKPTTTLMYNRNAIVAVYEGCNGLNVMIIFVAFIFSFGPVEKKMIWYIPLGMLIIHFSNVLRIGGLFLITLNRPDWLYFTHKYLFTAFIYAIVFLLWIFWLKLTKKKIA
jgi:exosortase family protein XrtF